MIQNKKPDLNPASKQKNIKRQTLAKKGIDPTGPATLKANVTDLPAWSKA